MTKELKFKSQFPNFNGEMDFELYDNWGDLSRRITSINVPENTIKSTYYFTAECGCCGDSDEDTESLDDLNYLSDVEFEYLVREVAKQD